MIKICLIFLFILQLSDCQSDQVSNLPLIPQEYQSKIYSGFVNISDTSAVHYILFESQSKNSSADPIVIHIGDNLGCSNLYNLVYENGPFIFYPNNTLQINPYSLNLIANVVYLEVALGTGFSYASPEELKQQDIQAVYEIIVKSINEINDLHQEYFQKEMYVTSNGFMGGLGMFFAWQSTVFSSLKKGLNGILVGNPITTQIELEEYFNLDIKFSQFEFLHNRYLIDDSLYQDFEFFCQEPQSILCQQNLQKITKSALQINKFNIYENCYNSSDYQNFGTPDCLNADMMISYFNREDVQSALHIIKGLGQLKVCNYEVQQNFLQTDLNFEFYFTLLIDGFNNNMKILVYSGDVNAKEQVSSTVNWMNQLMQKIQIQELTPSSPIIIENQVRGTSTKYLQNLTYMIIRKAGHYAFKDQPDLLNQIYQSFIRKQ